MKVLEIYPLGIDKLLMDDYSLEFTQTTYNNRKIIAIEFNTSHACVTLTLLTDNEREQKPIKVAMRLGKFLVEFFPQLKNTKKLVDILSSINLFIDNPYTLQILEEPTSVYQDVTAPDSCMSSRYYLTYFYNSQPDIKILVVYNMFKEIVGRALVWHNVKGLKKSANGIYVDRVYPANDHEICTVVKNYAKQNGWAYRNFNQLNKHKNIENSVNNVIWFKLNNLNNVVLLPYMDTFKYGVKNGWLSNAHSKAAQLGKTNVVRVLDACDYNVIRKVNDWINLADIENAKYSCDDLRLYSTNRRWAHGIHTCNTTSSKKIKHIRWEDGTWKNGMFCAGDWLGGIWEDGVFAGNNWYKGVWNGGVWNGEIWQAGKFKSGIMVYSNWWTGIWEDGIWLDGNWFRGTWKSGSWLGGTWVHGNWKKGEWYGGEWEQGIWHDGTWFSGTWKNGTWKNGTWKNGNWYTGIWKNGIWEGGDWDGGTWEGGIWNGGWILDREKKGNYEEDWVWKGEYVKSSINPREYFEQKLKPTSK